MSYAKTWKFGGAWAVMAWGDDGEWIRTTAPNETLAMVEADSLCLQLDREKQRRDAARLGALRLPIDQKDDHQIFGSRPCERNF